MGLPAALMYLTVLLLSQQLSPCETLRVAAFNIENFGVGKSQDLNFMACLIKFICSQNWDIAFLQELTRPEVLMALVNALNMECGQYEPYQSVLSNPLPERATNNKEIHAYIYRANKIIIHDVVTHPVTYRVGELPPMQADVFFRPPLVLNIEVIPKTVFELYSCMKRFLLIGIHTRPTRVYSELNGLVNVYDQAKKHYKLLNALILGDLNAGGGSFGPVDKMQNILRNRVDFKWLIDDNIPTNVGGSEAYDRIIAAGIMMARVVQETHVPNWYRIRGCPRLSDHFPVSADLSCFSRIDSNPGSDQYNPGQGLKMHPAKKQKVVRY